MANKTRHVVDDNDVKSFNWLRESVVGIEFNRKELDEKLKTLKYPQTGRFITAITNGINPPILKVKRGKYCFSPKPVYIERLKTVWNMYYNNKSEAQFKSKEKRIEDAILLLKNEGYKIQKPVLKYVEC